MTKPKIINGQLFSPYQIYFQREPLRSDAELLDLLGLESYARVEEVAGFVTYVVISDLGDWTLLADDFCYTIWNRSADVFDAAIALASQRDGFAWFVGDCDLSLAFCYYERGKLVRRFVVDSPGYVDQIVREDIGERLPFETDLIGMPDEFVFQSFQRYASCLGIHPEVRRESLRIYAKPIDEWGG